MVDFAAKLALQEDFFYNGGDSLHPILHFILQADSVGIPILGGQHMLSGVLPMQLLLLFVNPFGDSVVGSYFYFNLYTSGSSAVSFLLSM